MAMHTKFRSLSLRGRRLFSTSILSPGTKTPPVSVMNPKAALPLIRYENNPERIVEICRSATLSPEVFLERVAYSLAISKLKQSDYHEGVRGLIKDSLNQPHIKSERYVSHFIVMYGQAGLVSDAVKLFDEMPDLGVERGTRAFNSLLFACIFGGDYGEMKRIFSEFPRKYGLNPDLQTYNTILKGFCQSGSANSAHSILAEMERKGVQPNATTFAVAIAGFYKEEKFGDVEKMLSLMKKFGVKKGINIYNVRIQSLCKLNKSDEAKALLDRILSKGKKPNGATYGYLVYGFCREGKLDVAKSLFKEMLDKEIKPQSRYYLTLIYYLCEGRDFEPALDICQKCMAEGYVPNITTMKSLVNGLISIGKVEDAKGIIGLMKEKFPKKADKWSDIEEGLPKLNA